MSDATKIGEEDEDILTLVREALRRRGTLSKIKANIRAEVYHALEDKSAEVPRKPHEIYVVSELVREFLMKLNYNNTLSVFNEETGRYMFYR
jgi:lisH domain-containing protein FOPNL